MSSIITASHEAEISREPAHYYGHTKIQLTTFQDGRHRLSIATGGHESALHLDDAGLVELRRVVNGKQ